MCCIKKSLPLLCRPSALSTCPSPPSGRLFFRFRYVLVPSRGISRGMSRGITFSPSAHKTMNALCYSTQSTRHNRINKGNTYVPDTCKCGGLSLFLPIRRRIKKKKRKREHLPSRSFANRSCTYARCGQLSGHLYYLGWRFVCW